MGTLQPSAGVLSAVLGDHHLVFEPVERQVHLLNPTASLVWGGIVEGLDATEIGSALAALDGTPPDAADQVGGFVAELATLGLIGRDSPPPDLPARWSPPGPATGDVDGNATVCLRVPVLDELVEVSTDGELVDEVTAELASAFGTPPRLDASRSVHRLHVRRAGGEDQLELIGFGEARTAHRGRVATVLTRVLNSVAASNPSMLAVHAAGLVSPDGRVVVLAGDSGSGKSTLAGRLARAGWCYLGDEAIGLQPGPGGAAVRDAIHAIAYPKPLSLDAGSRSVLRMPDPTGELVAADLELGASTLAGDAGPIAAFVLVRHRPDAASGAERLSEADAGVAVASTAFNLALAGPAALDTVVAVAAHVPVWRLVHHGDDAPDLVDTVLRARL